MKQKPNSNIIVMNKYILVVQTVKRLLGYQ